ncbi:MAG: hypothetical protein MOB07_26525 [Acidobacteria bacterium]|nr:hypothetical protein [Acidobacteriota bacterium]
MSLHIETQTLQINRIPADKMQVLIERANALGTTPEEYALRLIVEGLEPREKTFSEWYGRLEEAEPFPDLGYWLSQDDAAKFDAAWEMVIEAHQIKGEDIRESRLQRSVGGLQRREG